MATNHPLDKDNGANERSKMDFQKFMEWLDTCKTLNYPIKPKQYTVGSARTPNRHRFNLIINKITETDKTQASSLSTITRREGYLSPSFMPASETLPDYFTGQNFPADHPAASEYGSPRLHTCPTETDLTPRTRCVVKSRGSRLGRTQRSTDKENLFTIKRLVSPQTIHSKENQEPTLTTPCTIKRPLLPARSGTSLKTRGIIRKILTSQNMNEAPKNTSDTATRSICMLCTKAVGKPINLKCYHRFCSECLRKYIKKGLELNDLNTKCPVSACFLEVTPNDIRNVLTREEFDKYRAVMFANLSDGTSHRFFYCPTPGCVTVFDQVKCYAHKHTSCTRCLQKYCLQCRKKMTVGDVCNCNRPVL